MNVKPSGTEVTGRQLAPTTSSSADTYSMISETSSPLNENEESHFSDHDNLMYKNWIFNGNGRWQPTDEAFTYCGLAFRGDTRSPEEIFRTGFISRDQSDIEIEFTDGGNFLCIRQLRIVQMSAVSLSLSHIFASFFPEGLDDSVSYVYGCIVTKGVKIFEKSKLFSLLCSSTSLSQSVQEIATKSILPEQVICSWRVSRVVKKSNPIVVQTTFDCFKAAPNDTNVAYSEALSKCVEIDLKPNKTFMIERQSGYIQLKNV